MSMLFKACFLAISLVLLTACQTLGKSIPVQSIYSGLYCQAGQGMQWLDDEQDVNDAIGASRIFGKSVELPRWDKQKQRLLIVSMGTRPSAGHVLTLTGKEARLFNETLYLPLHYVEPLPDMLQAAVVTSPCLLITLPKKEHYLKVLWEDQGFNLLVEEDIGILD